jgi:hypothetical protein
MSVNFGAGLAPAPNNLNANDAPPPQQPVAQPNAPTVGATAATVSPLTTPPADGSALDSTDPTLTHRQSHRLALNKLREDWIRVEKAIQEGDLKLVNHMLNEGLVPCLVEEDASGRSVWTQVPRDLFKHLHDLDLFDRFINLFEKHQLEESLYQYTIDAGNCVMLRRLVQSGVKGWQTVSQHFDRLISDAMSRGNAKQLNALLQLQKESYPTFHLDWSDVWFNSSRSTKNSQSVEVIAVLIRHLKPSTFSLGCQAEMFHRAAEMGDHHLVTALVEWLGDDIDTFSESPFWQSEQGTFSSETLATIVRGGFPIEGIRLPPPEQKNAQELQIVLYGPKLSKSPFAQMLVTAEDSSNKIINFVFCKALNVTVDPFLDRLPLRTQSRGEAKIAIDLFRNGLAAPLAIKLSKKMIDFLMLARRNLIYASHGLAYLACLNECLHPDTVDPFQDQLSIEQAKVIHDASLAVLEEKFGGPIGFFSRALACIGIDGSVDAKKLSIIYRYDIGLPENIVAQIGATLKALCAEVMASAVPLSLFKPGMTGADVQAAFHRWIQQGVAQRIVNRLPQDLGLSIAKRDWDNDDSDIDSKHALVTLAELTSPLNYLATSVISQYSAELAENIEVNSTAMVEACRALPPDAFRRISQYDTELDSSDESAPSDNEYSDESAASDDEYSDSE